MASGYACSARAPTWRFEVPAPSPKPTFFRTPAAFNAWLGKHHQRKTEFWVGYYKKASGKGGMTYKEALDEAMCFGWIDGVVQSVDADSYKQRWTPRKKDSHWSLVNVRRYAELDAAGRVQPPGRAAYARRTDARTGKASFEQPLAAFSPAQLGKLKADKTGWAFFEAQPFGYTRAVKHWVTTARQEATRDRRLAQLLECNAEGERIPRFTSSPPKRK